MILGPYFTRKLRDLQIRLGGCIDGATPHRLVFHVDKTDIAKRIPNETGVCEIGLNVRRVARLDESVRVIPRGPVICKRLDLLDLAPYRRHASLQVFLGLFAFQRLEARKHDPARDGIGQRHVEQQYREQDARHFPTQGHMPGPSVPRHYRMAALPKPASRAMRSRGEPERAFACFFSVWVRCFLDPGKRPRSEHGGGIA